MRLTNKSQSIIEYTLVIILVMAGLILMRPYVTRAINAHMRGWEGSIKDSMRETIREATPPPPPVCGDGFCAGPTENTFNCCADCGSCGDCDCCDFHKGGSETATNCNNDCNYCGDGIKYAGACAGMPAEDNTTCCEDATVCGDGLCCKDTGGSPVGRDIGCTGPGQDCTPPSFCGDGTCNSPGETSLNCCVDCKRCGDGTCNCGETCSTCVTDCGACPTCSSFYDGWTCENCSGQSGCTSLWCREINNAGAMHYYLGCGEKSTYTNGQPGCLKAQGTCYIDYVGDTDCTVNPCKWWTGGCPVNTDPCAELCGDRRCNASEDCSSCPADCGICPFCGDGFCNNGETCSTCITDCGACPPRCGDGTCNGSETCATCASDCGVCPFCGDGTCNGSETCATCADCCPCGNGICEPLETPQSCCRDCGSCGDCVCCGWAQGGLEQWSGSLCYNDCAFCGDGVPYTGTCPGIPAEDPTNCCQDFPTVCGDGNCCRVSGVAYGADYNCPYDCPETGYCGDGYCNAAATAPGGPENQPASYCCYDCGNCGDGICCISSGEDHMTCPGDCP